MTNVEIHCLLDIAINMGKSQMNQFYDALVELCNQLENDDGITEHIAVWELIMTNVANTFGDMGRYDESDLLSLRVIKESIQCYRMSLIELNLYFRIWNHNERMKKNILVEQGYNEKQYLRKCITLCQLNKNKFREMILKEKLEKF